MKRRRQDADHTAYEAMDRKDRRTATGWLFIGLAAFLCVAYLVVFKVGG